MDNTNKNQEETSRHLIDIFYKDDYRLNSLISQINNGALQSVVTKTDKTQGSVSDLTGSLGMQNCLEEMAKLLKAKSSKTPDDKRKLRELESELYAVKVEAMPYTSIFNNLHVLLPFLPTGIGLEVLADDSTVFTGSLKSEYLIDSEETISLNYGTTLPGKWNILGILDYKTTSNDEPAQDDVVATLHKAMSGISNLLVNPNSKATVIPIMIYRNLNL
ncbi:MAG: hypothetical protein MR545_07765 [Veillonellaceae bacterium]|nr:hypothetical protein [Veillonellaceae bacterium]